jgi:hypothetical protein
MRTTLALLLLAAPALAQDPAAEIEARMNACMAGLDVRAISARAEAWAAERDYEARVAALCESGDAAAAEAYADEVQAGFYAQDPEAARLFACLTDVLGPDALDPGAVCEQ